MRAAHLVRIDGDVDARRAALVATETRAVVGRPHEPWCAAVHLDLGAVTCLSARFVPLLRELRDLGLELGVTLAVTAPTGSPAHRVLAFHQRLGEPLPPITSDVSPPELSAAR